MSRVDMKMHFRTDDPYSIEVWDETGTVWFMSLHVDLVERDKNKEWVQTMVEYIVKTFNTANRGRR